MLDVAALPVRLPDNGDVEVLLAYDEEVEVDRDILLGCCTKYTCAATFLFRPSYVRALTQAYPHTL